MMRTTDTSAKVAVCISTYNGEKYLAEQLDSILHQEGVDVTLFVRDDGSSDGTAALLTQYAEQYENVILLDKSRSRNLGVRDSFLRILRYAWKKMGAGCYYSFSDQDDVWLPEKLKSAVDLLSKKQDKKGRLYFSNKTVVDEDLHVIQEERIQYTECFESCLFTSYAFGCTMVMDDALAFAVVKHQPKCYCYHDSWTYRLAKCLGASVLFDENSYIYYRQHEENVVGIEEERNLFYYVSRFWQTIWAKREHLVQRQIYEISRVFPSEVDSSGNRNVINDVIRYHRHPACMLRLIFNRSIMQMGTRMWLTWVYRLLLHQV